jgi:hypothetical protein
VSEIQVPSYCFGRRTDIILPVSELEAITTGGTMKRKKIVPVKKQRPKARPKADKGKGAEELSVPLLTPATET